MSIHVWRQTETQSTIINFYEEDFNIFNPRRNDRGDGDGIFRMEFPLMQWLVAGIYKLFGNHLIISRIFMFIVGLLSIFGMYKLLMGIFRNVSLALIGAWAFNFSPSFYYYTINPLPDNLALCFSIWGLALFFTWIRREQNYLLLFSGLFLSIGTLCKLPFILYFSVPLVYFLKDISNNGFYKKAIVNIIMVFAFGILPLAWYISVIPHWNSSGIISGIFGGDIPLLVVLDYLQFNLISTLPELLLNYGSLIFFLSGFYFIIKNKAFENSLFSIFFVWSLFILMYFIFEVNMIARIHDYYLFPFLPIIFIIVSYGAWNMLKLNNSYIKFFTIFVILILPITAYLRMQVRWDPESPGFNKDLLVYKEDLRNAVPGEALCVAGNDDSHFVFFYYLDKKGWAIHDDKLNQQDLEIMIEKGAKFLYSDTRGIDEKEEILPYLGKLILEKGTIRVYSLKNK